MQSSKAYFEQINQVRAAIQDADAIIIGAGAGLSTAAGFTYSGERFMKHFADFHEKYGIADMYSGGFYPFESLEEYWAWWSRHICCNRYDVSAGKPYTDLLALVKDKNYFVLTTNVDHQFQLAGFDKRRLFYTQGDYGLFQCSAGCHNKTYDNEEAVRRMVAEQRDMKIPSALIPHCPVCGKPMSVNLRCDDTFVQDEGWHAASRRYMEFLGKYRNQKIVLLELGVGGNTPAIIKYPFWKMTLSNPDSVYICVNLGEAVCPREIEERSVCIDEDIGKVLSDLTE
ncbi:MAG: Sir2 silent information regulator family NAD-dependent deacetylase [Clostridiales bacterium]|nr:Sir2 silent information regulator family NAD-dependent deacetylase [Clostridiales bacterium]